MLASPNSDGFAALNANAEATASVPAIFAVAASVICAARGLRVGPLTVEREELFAASEFAAESEELNEVELEDLPGPLEACFFAAIFYVLEMECRHAVGQRKRCAAG